MRSGALRTAVGLLALAVAPAPGWADPGPALHHRRPRSSEPLPLCRTEPLFAHVQGAPGCVALQAAAAPSFAEICACFADVPAWAVAAAASPRDDCTLTENNDAASITELVRTVFPFPPLGG